MNPTTFEHDLIGYENFADSLENFIKVEQQFVEGSLVIALSAEFGAGKTTFLTMLQHKLKNPKEEDNEKKPLVVSLNAWESDYIGDPLFAIVSAIVETLGEKAAIAKNITRVAKQIGLGICNIAKQRIAYRRGVDLTQVKDVIVNSGKTLLQVQLEDDAFTLYQSRKGAMSELKAAISEFVALQEPYVLFLVDELDRCRPDYAISYLETIKHIFDIKKAVFILAADRQQLENSAKHAFGAELMFDEYYRKFIHREATLPAIEQRGYERINHKYVELFVEQAGLRETFIYRVAFFDETITPLIQYLKLTPRQMQEAYRIAGHVCAKNKPDENGEISKRHSIIAIVMSLLKVGDLTRYQLLGKQQFDPKDMLEWVHSISEEHAGRWFLMFLMHGGVKCDPESTAAQILSDLKAFDINSVSDAEKYLCYHWDNLLGNHEIHSVISRVYKRIEELMQWQY